MHDTVCCEGDMKLADIVTNNGSENGLNPRFLYAMVILNTWHKPCQIGVIGYRIFWRTMCYKLLNWIEFMNQIDEYEIFIWVYNDKENIGKCPRKHFQDNYL